MPARSAFTLIELLVVITIIVVLLALLTPALDKAIYSATMAVCGAQSKTIATGATVYASSHKRSYPYRSVMKQNTGQPSRLISSWNLGGYDDRGMLDGYIGRDTYLDPFTPGFDIETVNPQTGDNIFSGYSVWYGFKYVGTGSRSMEKMGQKFSWKVPATGEVYDFSILASDLDHIRRDAGTTWASHPDVDGRLQEVTRVGAEYAVGGLVGRQFSSWWESTGAIRRGPVDLQYAYEDGSVRRIPEVLWDEWQADDGRMVYVPEHSGLDGDKVDQPDWHQLPRP